ncbi:MAG: response regulator transcription factor [Candidatus Melainabacteria bacterium]|jgi:two-component system KDP operon response regulator KdpE|nr:response regulator transcription factor [Candidatus Obscuribacterales bacterium]MCA0313927.1 response regulator transcription factor [Candidatus Melainabacteria bacterium]OPZ87553.1 MAG: KDP operon transcriptional regulatory protein KdpE [bacterium ADurb.Bin425]
MSTKILVIDDEPQIRRALKIGFERNGYEVQLAATGEEGLDKMAVEMPELLILDLAMPGIDGFEVCRQVRSWSSIPIIVLSVREREEDKIQALDCGADDFISKPFGVGELLARVRAVLRRSKQPEKTLGTPIFSEGDLEVDLDKRLVHKAGEVVHLTPKEYDLLSLLINNPNRVLTHRQLLTRVWGPEYAEDHHSLRVHIANLRNKIETDPARPHFIQTETRVGYRFTSKNF